MLLPLIAGRTLLPPRSEIYSSIAWRFGGHPFFSETIFEKKDAIDIAFIGSSRIWCGIDPKHVEKTLAKDLGRDTNVVTLGWNTAGFDALYFIAEDLLRNRKVELLVINDEFNPEIGGRAPHRLASRWFRYGDNVNALQGLPMKDKTGYYASAVLGMPRNLLGLFRSNLSVRTAPLQQFSPENLYASTNPGQLSGALRTDKNYLESGDNFVSHVATNVANPSDSVIYSPDVRTHFNTNREQIPSLQMHFSRKLAKLAVETGTKIVVLNFPSVPRAGETTIYESANWTEILEGNIVMLGIPPATLFKGMKKDEVLLFFSDPKHFNTNGQDYYTPAITPALIQIYHETVSR